MKKMIFILLFITLTCSVCETFEVRSAQSFYQVFKNEDVTLEWMFTTSSLDSLQISCYVITEHKNSVLLEYVEGDEIPPSGPFRGRVQLDKDVLTERRIRLHVSSLRTEDSGHYSCEVKTSEGFDWASCHITVTEELQIKPESKTETGPEPEDRNIWRGVWMGLLGLPAPVVCVFVCVKKSKPRHHFREETELNKAEIYIHEHKEVCVKQLSCSHADEDQTESPHHPDFRVSASAACIF